MSQNREDSELRVALRERKLRTVAKEKQQRLVR